VIIDEPRPLCSGCGKPLKRSTYFVSFRNRLPGKEYPTTITECQSLVEPGHHILRFQYARDVVWDKRGKIVDYGPDWYIYGANVWKGTYGNFGHCGKCLPYHKTTKFADGLKLLDTEPNAGGELSRKLVSASGAISAASGILVGLWNRAGSRFRRENVLAPVGTDQSSHLRLPDLSAESGSDAYLFPRNAADAEFLECPVFEATDAEVILMWRAFAHQRCHYADMLEKDPTNPHARERYDMLKGCMLKMRAQAEARGISVDFNPPEIISFGGLDWHDLAPESQMDVDDEDTRSWA
jgi:hypothetical protein